MAQEIGAHMSIKGMEQLKAKFAKLVDLSPTLAKEEIMAGALDVQRIAKQLVKQHGKGRVYVRKGKKHQASAPYDPPATDLGGLSTRLGASDAIQTEKQGMVVTFGPRNYPIAAYLEFGTKTMKPRPFLFRAFEEARPKIVKNMESAIKRFLKAIGQST